MKDDTRRYPGWCNPSSFSAEEYMETLQLRLDEDSTNGFFEAVFFLENPVFWEVCHLGLFEVKVAVNTIVPRSPFFCFCTSKPRLLHTSEKTRSNISVNGMALFVLFTTCVKGKTSADTHGERGGLPTRRDSGLTRYGCAPH